MNFVLLELIYLFYIVYKCLIYQLYTARCGIISTEIPVSGEVGCIGSDTSCAVLKAMLSVGYRIPEKGVLLSTGNAKQKADTLNAARMLQKKGYKLYATGGSSKFLTENGVENTRVYWPSEEGQPQALDMLHKKEIDMDGIFGGKNPAVNIRDFQWKTWTPMELNMDGWGSNEKYPHALGEPATSINRMYLKLKSELMPYAYSFAKEAVDGMPIIRAMFLEFPNRYKSGYGSGCIPIRRRSGRPTIHLHSVEFLPIRPL